MYSTQYVFIVLRILVCTYVLYCTTYIGLAVNILLCIVTVCTMCNSCILSRCATTEPGYKFVCMYVCIVHVCLLMV